MNAKHVTPQQFVTETPKAGTKECFLVSIGELISGAELAIPTIVVRGRREGPSVYIAAGSHAEETVAIDAVKRFAAQVKPEEVSGTLVLVPVQNVPAWVFRSTLYPLDAPTPADINVGGLKSGQPDGNMTGRVISALADSIALNADYAIELRGTHLDSINYPFTMVTNMPGESASRLEKRLDLCRNVGNELIRNQPLPSGGILWLLDSRGALTTAVEAGEGWRNLEPFPSILIRGIRNFCKAVGAMRGEIEMPQMQVEYTSPHNVFSNRGGMSHIHVKPGQYVQKGEVVGEVRDMFDDVLEEVKSPVNGIVGRCTLLPLVASGGRICNVAETDRGEEWENRVVPELERQIRFSGAIRSGI